MQSSAISGGAFDVPAACILDPLDPDTTVVNMAATKSESSVEADTFDGCRLCFWHFNENCIRHHTNHYFPDDFSDTTTDFIDTNMDFVHRHYWNL